MKLNCNYVLVLSIISIFCSVSFTNCFKKDIRWPYGILAQMHSNKNVWFLYSDSGFVFREVSPFAKKRIIEKKVLIISFDGDGFICNGISVAQKQFYLSSRTGIICCNSNVYPGIIHFNCFKDIIEICIVGSGKEYFRIKNKNCFLSHKYQLSSSIQKPVFEMRSEIETLFNKAKKEKCYTVRVLLDELYITDNKKWHFYSDAGFIVDGLKFKKRLIYKQKELIISFKNKKMYLNNKPVSIKKLYIIPKHEHITCDGTIYNGSCIITLKNERLYCVNKLNLEDYVCSVVRTESWPGWPLEVNKVFAIACRSYVLATIMTARSNNQLYDVKNTNVHQTYQGIHNSKIIKQAVAQTRGIFLGFNNKPALAMFDSCCGGIIPAHISDFNFNLVPYLAREYACTHCKKSNLYSWNVSYDHSMFEQLLVREIETLNTLRAIKVTKKDKAGLVREVTCKGIKNFVKLSGKKLYSLLKEVKSFSFGIQKKGKKIIVSGRGFGHHIGLCQWGAREMVRNGWDYKKILQFYYPQTYFMYLT